MMRRMPVLLGTLALVLAQGAVAQDVTRNAAERNAEWRQHHGDYASTRYSPLSQVDRTNVSRLELAWAWKSDSVNSQVEYKNESTPLMIDGVLYFTTGIDRAVVAVDAATGVQKWLWRLDEGARARVAPRRNSGRGVSYWSDGTSRRIFVVTPGFQLIALDAATGQPVAGFGSNGIVDLKLELGVELDVTTAAIGNSSPPLVYDDLVIVGPALNVGLRPPSRRNIPGRVLAIDARTGALRWRFNTIPLAGEFGNETWLNGSWEYTGNAGAWAPMSLDERRGWLYIPVEAATGDYYGGHRPGDNLFSTSLLCVDVRTGKRIWHYQIVHHDIWDYDNPTAPILADIDVDGRRIEAVVQLTKQSFAYVLDRVTGTPVWPIVERAVPQSDVPGERSSATQPIPSRPAPYDRQGVTIDDLIHFTPALRAEAVEAVKPFRLGALFAPASLQNAPDGTRGTLSLPGTLGGSNWEHGAFDTGTQLLYVGSYTQPSVLALARDSARSDMDYVMVGGRVPSIRGLPLMRPPYS
ncbi:MAG TPA: PQQ-binding-like beta-propeller repeat protein, partial [Longimicrobiales bacterium]|nr:PQQ-binding-like beta-propeller repeat protein [Longimicrobiales bacterium]